MTCDRLAVEKCNALKDIREIAHLYGVPVKVFLRKEQEVKRDSYGTIKSLGNPLPAKVVSTYTNDITRNPNERELAKAGVREGTDIIVWTPMLDWIDAGVPFEEIDLIRDTCEFEGVEYKLSDKNIPNRIGIQALYIVLGLKDK